MKKSNKFHRKSASAQGSAIFCPGRAGPQNQVVKDFIDQHCDAYAVEPICKVLQIAPPCYRRHASRQRNPALCCAPSTTRCHPGAANQRVWEANMQAYGADKVWHQMNRKGIAVARCTVDA